MRNKVENNGVVENTEKVYYNVNNLEGEMMRYRTNSLSYKLGMLAIVFSILAAFLVLNSLAWDFTVVIKILMNIVILLFGFLSIEKVKAYSKEYSMVLIGIGVVCGLRIFWGPLTLIVDYTRYLSSGKTVTGKLGPTITGSYVRNAYLWMDGYFRGITSMVLLGCAAACFILAGVIGIAKAQKYAKFMATQDTTKGV
ncbi:hypothetical protein HDR67_00395 [bacterium]|nr:hypothetical protein [bacterium]